MYVEELNKYFLTDFVTETDYSWTGNLMAGSILLGRVVCFWIYPVHDKTN